VLATLAQVVVLNTPVLGGALGVYTDAPTTGARNLAALFYLTLLGCTAVAVVLSFAVEHSRFGYALRAIREDEDAAAVLGVRTSEVKLWALLLGAALAGLDVGVYAFRTGYVEPFGTFALAFSLDIVLVCVIGGLGSWYGPLIGAFIVVQLEDWLRTTVPDLHPFGATIPAEASRLVLGVLLIVFALYARRGVAGLFRRRRGRQLGVGGVVPTRAAVLYGRLDLRVEEVPVPRPGPGEVLLRVRALGVCGTDAAAYAHGPAMFPIETRHPVTGHIGPMVIGHEFAGEVVEVGEG